jgi:hypothetical protein
MSGLTLTCVREERDFLKLFFDFVFLVLQNIVRTASTILDTKYKDHWNRVTALTGETAEDLVLSFDRYIATLSQSQEDTYTSPFEVVADNMGEANFNNCDLKASCVSCCASVWFRLWSWAMHGLMMVFLHITMSC